MKKILRLFMMSVLCGIVPISLLLSGVSVSAYTGNSSQTMTAGADIRVMSYNTLVDNDEVNGGWSWGQPLGNRAEKAAAAINYYKPDVIGLQENNYNWHVALRELLPDYDYVNANVPISMPLEKKESLGKKDWMCTTMMYNTKTLELVDRELYGYSCNYWGCIQRMRYVSMAVFKVKATGKHFVFISTHLDAEKDSKGQQMRRTQAGELAEAINYYKETYGYPVISTGDYNSGYNDDPIKNIRNATGMDSHSNNRGGIDYILYSQGVSPKYFTVVNDSDLSGASDHQPIMADLALQDGFSFPTTTTTTVATTTTTTTTTTTATTTRPTATQTTTTTQAKPIASATTTTTASVAVESSVNTTDTTTATTTQAVADVPTEESAPTTTIAAGEEPTVTASATQEAKPSQDKAVSSSKKDDNKDDEKDTNKDSVGLIIGIAAAVAVVGIIATVAAVLISKKEK